MLRSELVEALQQDNPHLTRQEVERIIETLFETVVDALAAGGRVELRGFGSFSVRYRKSRLGRNPHTGEQVNIPDKYVPFFHAGKRMKERLNASRPVS